jgi:hypothetical protein
MSDSDDVVRSHHAQPTEWRKGVAAASLARKKNADDAARILLPAIRAVQATGVASLRAIAIELNARGFRTVRGTEWTPMAVRRVLLRGQTSR